MGGETTQQAPQQAPQQSSVDPFEYMKKANAFAEESSSLLGNIWWGLKQGIFLLFIAITIGAPLLMFREEIGKWFDEGSTGQKYFNLAIAHLQNFLSGFMQSDSLGIDKDAAKRLADAERELATPEQVGAEIGKVLGIQDAAAQKNLGAQAITASKKADIALDKLMTKQGLQALFLKSPEFLKNLLDALPTDATTGKISLTGNAGLSAPLLELLNDKTAFQAIMADEDAKSVLVDAVKKSQSDDQVAMFEGLLKDSTNHESLRILLIGLLSEKAPQTPSTQTSQPQAGPPAESAEPPVADATPQPQAEPQAASVTPLTTMELMVIIAGKIGNTNEPVASEEEKAAITGLALEMSPTASAAQKNKAKQDLLALIANDSDQSIARGIAAHGNSLGALAAAGVTLTGVTETGIDNALLDQKTLQTLSRQIAFDDKGELTPEALTAVTTTIAAAPAPVRG